MSQKLHVIKIGGSVIENHQLLHHFVEAFVKVKGLKILVHGGGNVATAMGEKLGITPKMIEGRRITDEETLDIVTMVYGGLVNKKLVATLQSRGINSIGLTGADGNLMLARKRPVRAGIDYGLVGDIREVNVTFLSELLAQGKTPILAPLTHDGHGQMLNTNADTIASETAIAMSKSFEVDLSITFEKQGVMMDLENPDSLISTLTYAEYERLKSEFRVHSGMIPKLDNAFKVLESGVKSVRICRFDQIGEPDHGTILQA